MHSDEQLIRRCLAGERSAFDRLYDRYERRVFGLLRRLVEHDAEAADLTQETFLAAYRGLADWSGQGRFATWLCGIAARLAANARRQAGSHPESPLDAEEARCVPDGDPLLHLSHREAARQIETAIAVLPTGYREVFLLVRVDGWSYREVAAALEVPLGTVQSRLWRATLALQAALREIDEPTVANHEPPFAACSAPAAISESPGE